MKVLHVYKTYFPDTQGGLEEAIRQIALATNKFHKVENKIFALSEVPKPSKIFSDEGEVIRSKSWIAPRNCDIGLWESLKNFKKLNDWADIVHYHFPWPFADLLHLISKKDKPSIMTYHSDVVGKGLAGTIYNPLKNIMLRDMKKIIATSPNYISSSSTLSAYSNDRKLSVIPLGISEESLKKHLAEAEKINIEDTFGVKQNNYFLFIGVFRAYKGLKFLIESSSQTDLPILIAGGGGEESLYKQYAKEFKNIKFAGRVSDIEKVALLKNSSGVVLPSHLRSEAFGMVMIEASIFSKPLITCEINTGTSYVNKDNFSGLVVEPKSPEALSNAMNRISRDKVLAMNYGKNAKDRYKRLFSDQAQANKYIEAYNEILEN